MAFHTKYRPKKLKDVIGNKHITKSLKSLFKHDKLVTPVFLFHGASGCGKTTFARIIADKVGCSEFDFTVINASNNRGIGTAREILKTVEYKPMQGDTKVILLDEVHQTTKDFQNSLLTVLEEPPSHVYFILCTTEPRKLLDTLRRRCTTYEVEPLSDKQMAKLLATVMVKEKIDVDTKILKKLIHRADGCPRTALILLEQIIYLPKKDMKKAIRVFKTDEQKVIDLCKAILDGEKWGKIAKILRGIDEEPESVRRFMLAIISNRMLKKEDPRCMYIYMAFKDPFYETGKAGLTFSCYKAISYK